MPIRSAKTANPSKHVQDRSAKMRARLLQYVDDFEQITDIEVGPDEEGKAVRVVRFRKIPGDFEIECFDKETLVLCDANRYARHCSHVNRAVGLLEALRHE